MRSTIGRGHIGELLLKADNGARRATNSNGGGE